MLSLLFINLLGLGGCWYIICVILGDEVVEFVADDPEDPILGSPNVLCLTFWLLGSLSLLTLFEEITLWNAEFFPLPILAVPVKTPFGVWAVSVFSILLEEVDISVFVD